MTHKTVVSAILTFSLIVSYSLVPAIASERRPVNQLSQSNGGIPLGSEAGPAADGSKSMKTRGVSMRVLWTVSGYVIGKSSVWDEKDAKALLFKPLDKSETGITFNGRSCNGVIFQQETVNAAEYLDKKWQITPQALGIDDKELQVFKTDCDIPGFQQYIRLRDGRLIVPINGVFFFFEPAVTR